MLVNGYLQRAELKTAIGDTTLGHDEEHDRAIEAASRQIDLWCGPPPGRQFWQDTAASPRVFRAKDRTMVCINDFDSTSGLIVETDDDADGIFETLWDVSEWQAEPFNRWSDHPYTCITTTTRDREFPLDSRRPRVKVTTKWGWVEPPLPVKQACMTLATLYFRSKDMAGVGVGIDFSTTTISADPVSLAMKLVQPYAISGGQLYGMQKIPTHG